MIDRILYPLYYLLVLLCYPVSDKYIENRVQFPVWYGYVSDERGFLETREFTEWISHLEMVAQLEELIASTETDFWIRVNSAGAYPHLSTEIINYRPFNHHSLLGIAVLSMQYKLWGSNIKINNNYELTPEAISNILFRMPAFWFYNAAAPEMQKTLKVIFLDVMGIDAKYLHDNNVMFDNSSLRGVAFDVYDALYALKYTHIPKLKERLSKYIPI